MGRPSKKSPEVLKQIYDRLCTGEPLTEICTSEGMPHPSTVRDWMAADAEVSRAIACAREIGFDAIATDALRIADDGRNDWVESQNNDGTTYTEYNGDHVQRSRLRVETRLKLLAKWDPKRYGDLQKVEMGGSLSVRRDLRDLTDDELLRIATQAKAATEHDGEATTH